VALAAFISELATSDNNSGIVFDDPVSSLDHEYREQVAQRLAGMAARERQVVVFTHDIAFVSWLYRSAKDAGVEPFCQSVYRVDGNERVGVCEAHLPFNHQGARKAIETVERMLDETRVLYEQEKMEEWGEKADTLITRLRRCWEKAVAEVLSPVVERFSTTVDTKNLRQVAVLTNEDCDTMRYGFQRCSELQHDQGAEMSPSVPEPEDIKEETERIKGWLESIAGRQRSAQHG